MSTSVWLIASIFAVTGVMHFVVPAFFEAIVPRWLPTWMGSARTLVYLSGVAELLGALGLLWPATRTAAGWWLIALLLAVLPANVQMLLDARSRDAATWWVIGLWIRLPLQPLFMWWIWRSVIRAPSGGSL